MHELLIKKGLLYLRLSKKNIKNIVIKRSAYLREITHKGTVSSVIAGYASNGLRWRLSSGRPL